MRVASPSAVVAVVLAAVLIGILVGVQVPVAKSAPRRSIPLPRAPAALPGTAPPR